MPELLHYAILEGNKDYYTCAILEGRKACDKSDMRFRLQHYRLKKGFTQAQVAEAIGISQGLYNQLESGKRRMNETYLASLAEFYSISPVQLIIDETNDDPLYAELDAAYRLLSPAERRTLVSSAKGIVADREPS